MGQHDRKKPNRMRDRIYEIDSNMYLTLTKVRYIQCYIFVSNKNHNFYKKRIMCTQFYKHLHYLNKNKIK